MGRIRLLSALVAGTIAVSAQAAVTEAWVATTTKAHDPRTAVHIAPLRAGEQVHIAISLKLRNKGALDVFTANVASGKAKPLTSEEFLTSYAPSAAQAAKVVAYLQAHGFVNIEVAENRLLITADGGAGSIKEAFKAELHEYNVDGRSAFANVTDAMVPAHLADTVLGVMGLQTVHMFHTFAKRIQPDAHTEAVAAVSIPNFPSIYGATSLPSATNATIGIITQGAVTQTITDLKSFASSAGYPVPPVTTTVVGTASTDTSGIDEWNMDSQSSLAAAGGTIKAMILYDINSLTDANLASGYNKAVTDNKAKTINVSIGGCENDEGSAEASTDQIFQTAVAQGQTFTISTGDSGAYECGGTTKAQSYPAVSPYVMAIGGTSLSSSGGTWQGETVWACSSSSTCASAGGTGGGPSLTETAASWQTASGVLGSSSARGVPDISFDADPNSGALVLIKGKNVQIGGTSLSAPLFAGFYGRIQSASNNTLAFPATKLYQGAAANPGWFHDVTSGSNGYSAGVGWDYASGYGSLIIANFAGTTTTPPPPPPAGPAANFTDTISGLTATFVDTSTDTTGTITTHSWNFGDGSTSTTTNPTHTYASPGGSFTVTETVTDNNSQSNAHSSTVTVSTTTPPPPPPSNLIVNGGFESTATPWTLTSGVLCTNASCTGEVAHAGTGFAWLDGYGKAHTDSAVQTVTIPSTVSTATLSFYLHIDTAETGSTAYDKLSVQVLSSSGAVLATLATYSNLNANTGYALKSLSMTAYKGQTVKVKFNGVEDSSLATSFIIDDVSLATN